ncbi:MAG: GAF domain-containing protein [Candidatus Marinimicrobia bacterium]|nr:GAF domain-containing protein [Candidatus Neomarinimicrobiota bacterium]
MINKDIKIEVPTDILENWQEIANILAEIIEIPAALIMRFVDPYIEVFVSSNSAGNPYDPGDKETLYGSGLYCETVIKTQDKLLVPDALADANWKDNPDVKLNMISYLGFPILLPDKKPFGTICVLDNKSNQYSKTTEKLMLKFRSLIESQLEMIYMNQILGDKNKQLTDYLMELQALRGFVSICANCKSIKDDQNNWHPVEHYLIQHPEAKFSHGICPECKKELYPNHTSGS